MNNQHSGIFQKCTQKCIYSSLCLLKISNRFHYLVRFYTLSGIVHMHFQEILITRLILWLKYLATGIFMNWYYKCIFDNNLDLNLDVLWKRCNFDLIIIILFSHSYKSKFFGITLHFTIVWKGEYIVKLNFKCKF